MKVWSFCNVRAFFFEVFLYTSHMQTYLYAFTLGREYKLSLAELAHIFGFANLREHSETVAIFEISELLDPSVLQSIGGTIRIIEIIGESDDKRFATDVLAHIKKAGKDGKVNFALGAYGTEFRLSDIGLRIKKTLHDDGLSARLVNTKNENINAATWKKERLGKSHTEYNIIKLGETSYLGTTLACQDIDAYARRDTGKSRDMVVGMMPPKLVQMMINIGTSSEWKMKSEKWTEYLLQKSLKNKKSKEEEDFWKELTDRVSDWKNTNSNSDVGVRRFSETSIYDPFCGLGTTLIEAANMGFTTLYGSDISPEMVQATESSLREFIKEEKVWQERIKSAGGIPKKDFSNLIYKIWQMDARNIKNLQQELWTLTIVSEWYLGEIMSPRDITLDRVKSERRKLADMYDDFFGGLRKENFCNNIVMSFPFWNIHGVYSYFTEIYDVIEKHGFTVESLLPWEMQLNTTKWSLLYRRENQTVGREIIKIVRK